MELVRYWNEYGGWLYTTLIDSKAISWKIIDMKNSSTKGSVEEIEPPLLCVVIVIVGTFDAVMCLLWIYSSQCSENY